MKKILLSLIMMPMLSIAQDTYTFKDISGKWIEQTRTDKNRDVTPFKDTLYIEIRDDGFMMVRHTVGATSYGDAELKENIISVQKEAFTIEGNENGILKLKEGKITHRLTKQPEFTDAPVTKVIPGVEIGEVLTTFENLKGKWTVYKKTDPNFGRKTFYIKILDIKEKNMGNLFSGSVTFHNMDSIYTDNATIKVQGKDFHILSPTKTIKGTLLKSDGEEIIVENNGITYFLKRFGK